MSAETDTTPIPRERERAMKASEEEQEKAKRAMKAKWQKLAKQDREKMPQAQVVKVESYMEQKGTLVPKQFDPSTLPPDALVIYNGRRRTGKTFYTRFNLWAQRHFFRAGEVFTNTPNNGFWQHHFPNWKVFKGWQPAVVESIIEEQRRAYDIWREYPWALNPYRVVVLEDCANELTHDKLLEDLAAYGRHYAMCVHVITQHPQKLPPIVRSNADVAIIFPLNSRRALECLAEDYIPQMPHDDAIQTLTTYAWKKPNLSQALIIDNRGDSLRERLFFGQAKDPGAFLIGCEQYWEGEATVPDAEELEDMIREREEEEEGSAEDSNLGEQ
jgi:hypothetical protein